ncbi:hypothetical protein MGMO_47c00250 [Methyloglobulus morosus KoM1]|uniref:Uncharacterized protein n=1 Tax=Methyloglobulus morosus KoM1 TaxID=1116472 RepID=V5C2S0_9GAMM|nr:hypothetical protein MGMO_47c00250 [Methyloglobulus morosus KoM1]
MDNINIFGFLSKSMRLTTRLDRRDQPVQDCLAKDQGTQNAEIVMVIRAIIRWYPFLNGFLHKPAVLQ